MGRNNRPSGRYQAICGDGFCAASDNPGRSKIEGQIFTLLDFVLGGGRDDSDLRRWSAQLVKVDMLFQDPAKQPLLVVEYDGAYFHRDREERDYSKAMRINRMLDVPVIRIREAPLQCLTPWDLVISPRAKAEECCRLLLLHLLHFYDLRLTAKQYSDMEHFLSIGNPLAKERLLCRECRRLARSSPALPWAV